MRRNMPLTATQLADQRKQAEELLFSGPEKLGFAKALFFGHFTGSLIFPYPEIKPEERAKVEQMTAEVRQYVDEHLDAMAIDRNAEIPQHNVDGLGRVGVLGVTAPIEFGGRGLSQLANTKIMEIIGGHCSSTAVFVNAHHSIGIRSLLMFGTEAQKQRWLPDLVSGKKLAAFALTETEAGSDAANVQTSATLAPDGKTWILNGSKRYITNGGIAGVLTVMARTPVPGSNQTKVTAFLVTPDMPGFKVLEARMPKCGIRGTATAKLAFENMPVPAENIVGQLGKGLRLALTMLDFGRTTFGASCTGAAKTILRETQKYAMERVQFKQKLGDFELVKKKIAYMAAHTFAMEATTTQCAAFIDRDIADYMLETAMLKVWSTEALWIMVNDMMQIYGGKGYFSDQPYRAHDARCPDQSNRRGRQRRAPFVHHGGGNQAGCRSASEREKCSDESAQGFRQAVRFRPQANRRSVRHAGCAGPACKSQSSRCGARQAPARIRPHGAKLAHQISGSIHRAPVPSRADFRCRLRDLCFQLRPQPARSPARTWQWPCARVGARHCRRTLLPEIIGPAHSSMLCFVARK